MRRPYILCVDDEQAVLNQLAAQLTRQLAPVYRVEVAESAEEGLEVMDEIEGEGGEVHLVICDQVMPGMKGDRFLEAVHERRPEVMKILLTGQAGLQSAIYAINHAGLHRYVEKPWEPEDLAMSVEGLLTQFRLRRDVARQHERLERRTRELHSLHEVGRGLGAASQSEGVLTVVAQAAHSILGVPHAEAVAQVGRRDRPWWSAPADGPFTVELRRALEMELGQQRIEGRIAPPSGLPEEATAVPIAQGTVLFGWIVVLGAGRLSADALELLAILAGQAATTLANIALLEERLASERLTTIGRMISTIVHDFRNPMTAIRGYAAMIEDMDIGPQRRRQCAHMVVEETDRMNGMIDEILEFTRSGPARLQRRVITLEALAARLRRVLEPDMTARGVTFVEDLSYRGPVAADADRLLRAMLNVASNALEAMEPGGTLTLRARRGNGEVEIDLADTGRGIPEELQARIYEPFFTHGKTRGIGLGMSITRKIVEEHGGHIRLQSEVGRGTCFTLCLPLADEVVTFPTQG